MAADNEEGRNKQTQYRKSNQERREVLHNKDWNEALAMEEARKGKVKTFKTAKEFDKYFGI